MFGPVPEDKSDTRIVVKGPGDGEPPDGLRITKTVRGNDASLYTFLLPGIDPDPLKLSIHPFGEIQLKSRGAGLITRLDKGVLIEGLKSGALDSTLGKLLTPRLAHERAEGFILRPDMFPVSESKPDEPLKDVDMPLDAMLAGLTKIEIADTTELAKAMAVLREDGMLPPRTMLLLATEGADKPIVFVSALEKPLEGESLVLPEGSPMPKMMQAVLDSLREYGGILFTMPDEADLREMASLIGLGGLFDGIQRYASRLDEPGIEANVLSVMEQILPVLAGPIRTMARAKPVQPLRPKRPARVIREAPPGGWVRRRPRRRGHTAPL
jgi:hypothetical protein